MDRDALPPILELGEALAWLCAPLAHDEVGALTARPLIAIDLTGGAASGAGAATEARLAAACEVLATLPCVTVGVGPVAAPEASPLAALVDVLVESTGELALVADRVGAAPQAACVLVQTLRADVGSRGPFDPVALATRLLIESLAYGTLLDGVEHRRWLQVRGRNAPRLVNPEPAVLVSRSGMRLDLTLNRPERRNAFSAEMRDALFAGLDVARADGSLEEIVISGLGPDFCSGGDLTEFGSRPDLALAHTVRAHRSVGRAIASCAERVRFDVHGACIGAGIELPAFARQVVAKPGAYFQLPELAMGLIPGAGGTVSLPRRIGRQRTAYMALTGARIDTATALGWGLVDEIEGAPASAAAQSNEESKERGDDG